MAGCLLLWLLLQKQREMKRQQHRQRREQAHQEALAAKKQSIMASPRPGAPASAAVPPMSMAGHAPEAVTGCLALGVRLVTSSLSVH